MRDYPDCPRGTPAECRFTSEGGTVTCIGWSPVFDRNGKQLNADPNIFTYTLRCIACGAGGTVQERAGDKTVTAHQGPKP